MTQKLTSSKLSSFCGLTSLLLGLLVIIGWYSHSPALIQIHPSFVPMQFNTALGFLICGITLVVLNLNFKEKFNLISFVAIAIGGLTLVEYIFALDLGIDQLFMEHYILVETSHPGRMAPNTALCFVITGIALWLLGGKKISAGWCRIPAVLGALVFALGAVAFSGYLVNLETAYGWGNLTRMAIHTSTGFIILGVGIISISQVLIKRDTSESGKPHILIGIATLTIAICLWQALETNTIVLEDKTILAAILLAAGTFYVLALAVIFYLYEMSSEQKQRFHLATTMIVVALSVGAISLYFSHKAALEDKRLELINIVQSRARIIEAVARFDLEQSADFPEGHVEATLSQFREAHEKFEGFGETGEYNLAKKEADQIVFLLRHRHSTATATATATGHSIPLNSTFAEPMRRALKGESGIVVGLDYRGKTVLTAYEPVAVLNLGLVAKVDLAEIRAPFIKTGLMAGIGGLITIVIGLFVFFRISEPLIRSIKDLQGKYEMAVKGSKNGLWGWPNVEEDKQWWSDDWYALLGIKRGAIESNYSGFKSLLHPDDLPRLEDAINRHFYGNEKFDVEYRLKHKNGEYKWFCGRGTAQRDRNGKAISMSGTIFDIHEQKINRETIDKLSQVAQQIPVSVLITDHEGNIEFVNEALSKLSGYSSEEVLGKSPRMFKSGESPDSYYQVLWKTISQGKEWRGVFHNKKKNGELYWESVLIFPLKDINGKVSHFIGLKEDISEKKRLESTLIDHERLIRSVVNNLKDGLIISNLDGNIQLFNKGAEEIFGYSAEEVMDKPVEILMGESYKGKHEVGFARFKKTRKISLSNALMEVEAKKKDGTIVPIELTLTQMEQRGELLVIGLVRDISQRKEAEQKHQESEVQLGMVTAAAEIYFWDWKINTDEVIHDPRWIKFLGYSEDEFKNTLKQCKELIHPEDLPQFEKALNDHIKGNTEVFEAEYRTLKRSGEWVWTLDKGKILERDEDGKPLRAYGTFLNIHERKQNEEKIAKAQKQLVASEKLAGVGELAAGVSHEVLNPVNIISVHTQMLQRKAKDDSNIQNFCDKIKHEIERIQKIMGSLLAFSRKGQADFKKGPMRDAIESVLTLVEEEYKLDNIKIVRDWCDNLVEISYDLDKIRQVYLNLIHNAKHAMPDGGTITVGCRAVKETSKHFHQFIFSDTGEGMSDEVKLKIFEPFFTTKTEGQGTGMGLAVIHGIIQEHGGKIRVESEKGKGTTFIISLPLA